MNTKKLGAELQARYSFVPNCLGYCGPNTFQKIYVRYLQGQTNIKNVERELKKFIIPFAYLKLIAKANKMKPWDYKVVEAFWLGNELLNNIKYKQLRNFILHDLVRVGLDKERALKLIEKMPKGMVPSHCFHVIFVQFITNKVDKTTKNFDNCHVGWGRVLTIKPTSVTLRYVALDKKNNKYMLTPKVKTIKHSLLKNVKKGDIVTTHWNTAIQKITNKQAKNLKKYTLWNMNRLNRIIH
ncbi:hypothetical protein J4450_01025 [Candidatus Micrarchaeota archaeon]|nr:hypothetical protein [Candidatus Micrarchaeota archaeon]